MAVSSKGGMTAVWVICYKLECGWLSANLRTAEIRPKHGGDAGQWGGEERGFQ